MATKSSSIKLILRGPFQNQNAEKPTKAVRSAAQIQRPAATVYERNPSLGLLSRQTLSHIFNSIAWRSKMRQREFPSHHDLGQPVQTVCFMVY